MNITNRITHDVLQGTGAWLRLREGFDTASEAPAALGVGKYVTRAELLRQKHTGISPEHSPATLGKFAAGHEAEARARRGRLKVFLGMCPGVGKTFAMLRAAQQEANMASERYQSLFGQMPIPALVLDAMGKGSAATKYNIYASLSNFPIWWLGLLLGRVADKMGPTTMLRTEAALGIAMHRVLDLDHVRPVVGQHLRAPGAGQHAGEVQHLEVAQR